MAVQLYQQSDTYVLNHCAKHLARAQGQSQEAWRFPIVDPHPGDAGAPGPNAVTFVWDARGRPATEVGVIGTFATLYEPVPLRPVLFAGAPTGFHTVTALVPRGEIHTYRFLVDGEALVDPINPQRVRTDDGAIWSRFFTDACAQPLCLERWEYALLQRFVAHVLPFRTADGERFLAQFYFTLDRAGRDRELPRAYRLDDQVGIVNYIDNVLAREENHRLVDYKLALSEIDRVLRQRNPFMEPAVMPREMFVELYEQMSTDAVSGWNKARYGSPRFFLQLLRRHALTGAFSHPRYGGNAGGAAWAFLAERYRDAQGKTLFDWRQALEPPLGTSTTYRG